MAQYLTLILAILYLFSCSSHDNTKGRNSKGDDALKIVSRKGYSAYTLTPTTQ